MGNGYWILVWDDFGAGLVLINPRMHVDGVDLYGNPRNWWPCAEGATDDDVEKIHGLDNIYVHYRIIFGN